MPKLNVDNTHPGVREVLEKGALTIRRTSKSFSRAAVDLTLEQTVNADAASRKTGISAFQTDSTRTRWMITRSTRSAIVSTLLHQAGLRSPDDVVKELKPYRIQKDNNDMKTLIEGIMSTMNPFSIEDDNNLYCLSTGQKVPDAIKDDLLAFTEKGKKWSNEFSEGCFNDSYHFEKSIPRRKVKFSQNAAIRTRITTKEGKVIVMKNTRDLFGRLLYLSITEQLNMEKVFTFPLTPVPLTLVSSTGHMNKTDQSKLLHRLEQTTDSNDPISVDATLVDAMFFLHTLVNPPNTFGGIAHLVLEKLCQMSERVDFTCDNYRSPSIKDVEHEHRNEAGDGSTFVITGPKQTRPKIWQQSLKSASFKTALCTFFSEEWRSDKYAKLLTGHLLYVAIENECYRFTTVAGSVTWQTVDIL